MSSTDRLSSAVRTRYLVKLFITQLTVGCGDPSCSASTCATHSFRISDRPFRRYTTRSATAAAFWLATTDNPLNQLCPSVVARMQQTPERMPLVDHAGISTGDYETSQSGNDPKSFIQQLFDTRGVHTFVNRDPTTYASDSLVAAKEFDDAYRAALFYLHQPSHLAPLGVAAVMTCIENIQKCPNLVDASRHGDLTHELMYGYAPTNVHIDEAFEDERMLAKTRALTTLVFLVICSSHNDLGRQKHFKICQDTAQIIRQTVLQILYKPLKPHLKDKPTDQGWDVVLALDFVPICPLLSIVTIIGRGFRHSWGGESFIARASTAEEALLVLNALRREMLRFVEREWVDSYFATFIPSSRYGDPMEYASKWLDKESIKGDNLFLLEYPWLFQHSKVVDCFRAICFRRMENAVEEAHLNARLLVSGLSWHSADAPQIRALLTGALKIATSRSFQVQVGRVNLVDNLLDQLWRREKRELLRPLRVEIANAGEEGLDQGGVAQELFQEAFSELLRPDFGIFNVDPVTRMAWFDPASIEPAHKFELIGVLFALAVHNGFLLPVTFPLVFYRRLLGHDVHGRLSDIEDGWPELARGFKVLLEWEDDDVADVLSRSYVFSFVSYGQVIHVDLSDEGRARMTRKEYQDYNPDTADDAGLVTNENRALFVRDYILELTYHSVTEQMDHFIKGFSAIIPKTMQTTLTASALKTLVEGHQLIDVDALAANTTYEGYESTSPFITDFWEIVRSFDDDMKRKLLEFVTASDRLPVSGVRGLQFGIHRNGGDSERLPTSVTCFSRLLLPAYKGRGKMEEKLRVALGESKGFGLR